MKKSSTGRLEHLSLQMKILSFVKRHKLLFILLFFASLVLRDLFHSGLPATHDGIDHVARIANFYSVLSEGLLVPRWAPNLNWGYGHPILMFLYPLSSYVAAFFHSLSFSYVDSVKLVFATSYILSGLFMYLWLNKAVSPLAGFFGALLYLMAPYRFVDLYVRGAIGEHVAFIFPPLICYFLYMAAKQPRVYNFLGITLSFTGLILAHNAISLMFLPPLFLYALYLKFSNKLENKYLLFSVIPGILLGFGIASFFWIPAFFEGKYTLRDIVTKGEYVHHFVPIMRFIYSPWSYGGSGQFSVQLGFVQWIVVIGSIFLLRKKNTKKEHKLFTVAVLTLLFIVIFLMTPYAHVIWNYVTILQKFQFPWRFLSVTTFLTALLGAIFLADIPKRKQLMVLSILMVLLFFENSFYWRANGYIYNSESFYSGVYKGTTDTGESAPRWSVRFMEHVPGKPVEVILGSAVITQQVRTAVKHSYIISVTSDKARILENTLYFPNWVVYVDGKQENVEFQDQRYRGLITFYLPKGKHIVVVEFKDTKLRNVANIFSILSFVLLLLYSLFARKLWQESRS